MLLVGFDTHQIIEYVLNLLCSTASDSYIQMLCYPDFIIHRSSRRKGYMFVLILTRFLSKCVDLALQGLLVFRALKCFFTPTLTYTAQVDESVFISVFKLARLWSMCWTCIVRTVHDSRFKMLCYVDFITYRSSQRKCGTYLYWNSLSFEYVLNLHCEDC